MFITNRKAHTDILGRLETESEWQENYRFIEIKNYAAIVFTKFGIYTKMKMLK